MTDSASYETHFKNFLALRGVTRITKRLSVTEIHDGNASNLPENNDSFSGSDSDVEIDSNGESIVGNRYGSPPGGIFAESGDADLFYYETSHSFQSRGNWIKEPPSGPDSYAFLDRDSCYVPCDASNTDQQESHSSDIPVDSPSQFPRSSQEAFKSWEFHKRDREVAMHPDSDNEFNKDVFVSHEKIDAFDQSRLVGIPPGAKFRDSIRLESLGFKKFFDLECIRKYKNNVSSIISDDRGHDYLVLGSNSEFYFYGFDEITKKPLSELLMKFDTCPSVTTTSDRLISTWPYFPHTVNFIKDNRSLFGRPVLGACFDDGMIRIWFNTTLTSEIEKTKRKSKSSSNGKRDVSLNRAIEPDYQIKMDGSAWGIDFLTYKDSFNSDHNVVVISDNSRMITLIYIDLRDNRLYQIRTHQLLHNVPEISFLDSSVSNDGIHSVTVSCVSIYGELVTFNFKFKLRAGPLNEDEVNFNSKRYLHYVDNSMALLDGHSEYEEISHPFDRLPSWQPIVTNRVLLDEDGWSTKPVNTKFFKVVESFHAMTGDLQLNEEDESLRIEAESSTMDCLFDPLTSSNLGIFAPWQFFVCPVIRTESRDILNRVPGNLFAELSTMDDKYRRLHKGLARSIPNLSEQPKLGSINGGKYRLSPIQETNTNLLLVSTSKRVGLFRGDSLFCNCATGRLFNLSIPFSDESKSSNRISITHIIPELLCYIAVSQQGLVSIFRLCQFRGVYGMRQEHIFPNAVSLALGYHGYRTIAGLATRKVSPIAGSPVFMIYLTYTDGIVLTCKLSARGIIEFGETEM